MAPMPTTASRAIVFTWRDTAFAAVTIVPITASARGGRGGCGATAAARRADEQQRLSCW